MKNEPQKESLISFRLPESNSYLQDYLENKVLFKQSSEGIILYLKSKYHEKIYKKNRKPVSYIG